MKTIDFQIKSFEAESDGQFTAYGNVKWVVDRVRDCAVDGCYKWNPQRLPKMLLQHDHTKVCGSWLELVEDEKGLKVKGQLALNTQIGRETYEFLKMGALDSLSIGYIVKRERYDSESNINYLEEIELREISIVSFECNQLSLIEDVKSEDLQIQYKNIQVADESQEQTEQIEVQEEETQVSEDLNTIDEESSTENELQPENEIDAELMAKLDELVISIKLSQLI